MICPTCKRAFTANGAAKMNSKADSDADSNAGSKTASPPDATTRPPLPFCSPRCRAADLGNWLSGNYRIVTPASDDELDSGPDSDGDTVH